MSKNDTDPKDLYLISAFTRGEAREIAEEKGIPWENCVYVTRAIASSRWKKIQKYKGLLRDRLIGKFTLDEIHWLTLEP